MAVRRTTPRPLLVFLVGSLAACGRTGFGPTDDILEGGADEGPAPMVDPDDEAGDDRPEPDPELPPPVDMEGCGNGIVEEGELCYLEMVVFPSRIDPCAIDVGDLDGDGHVDIAVPNSDFEHAESADNFASVLYGDGQGNLSDPSGFLAGGDFAVGITIADFDNNDIDDLAITNSEALEATVLLGLGERSFGQPRRLSMGPEPTIAAAGDLNADGNMDLAVTTAGANSVMVALGFGDGSFADAVEYQRAMTPWDVEMLDIDNDGALDLLVTDRDYADVEVFWGDGTGALLPGDPIAAGDFPKGLTVADFNGDGWPDLVTADIGGATVLINESEGSFWRSAPIEAGSDPREVAVADFDNNGSLDLAILASGSEDITFAVDVGDYEYAYADLKEVGTLPSGIRAADFNEDGVPDLAVSNQLDNTVGLILSNP
ncbi:MAG: VCBS repeat-containing protein [Myxococcota bacterium]